MNFPINKPFSNPLSSFYIGMHVQNVKDSDAYESEKLIFISKTEKDSPLFTVRRFYTFKTDTYMRALEFAYSLSDFVVESLFIYPFK